MKFHKDAAASSLHQDREILCLDSNFSDHCGVNAETIKFDNKVSINHDQGHYLTEDEVMYSVVLLISQPGWK